jgi:hypothetical protein
MKNMHDQEGREGIFNDDDDGVVPSKDKSEFSEMRETRTGFGAKGGVAGPKKEFNPGQHNAEGGLQPDDEEEDEDVEEDGEEEDEDGEGVDVEDDEDEGSDHNF